MGFSFLSKVYQKPIADFLVCGRLFYYAFITERDLDEAIAKCQGESNPTNSTCIKLAAFLTLKDYLYPQELYQQYSYSAPPIEQVETYIETNGDSEFLKAVDGRKADKVWKLIDELVEAVKILHPRMYTTFIDKVQDL